MPNSMEIWTEKYRPKALEEVIGQEHVTKRVSAMLKKGSLPNMLFSGPAGTGKTTVSLCIAKQLFGEHWKANFMETNASDERGINTVRVKIKDFAKTKPIGEVPHKIIYLDEADSLTSEAQQALRRTMETYAKTCRFILSCNYSSKIIEPIQSRCAVFRFRPHTEDALREYLQMIAKEEGLQITKSGGEAILHLSEGDMRKAVNILQAAAALGKIDEKTVFEVTSQANPKQVRSLMETALSGDFKRTRKELMDVMIERGLSGIDVVKEMHRQTMELSIDEKKRVKLMELLGECEFRLTEGSDDLIQLEALLAQMTVL